jgi:protein O-mannosyl-transferase
MNKKERAVKPSHHSVYPNIFTPVLFGLAGFFLYSNSLHASFHWDDFRNIVSNESIRNILDLKSIWGFEPRRFVGLLTFAIDYHFHGLDVYWYHIDNILIHIASSLMVWLLVREILSSPRFSADPISRGKTIIPIFCGLIFLCHPLQTQAVTYIVQRMTSLAALFSLASLYFYLKGRLASPGGMPVVYFIFSALLITAGIFTKEFVYSIPIALLLLELFVIRADSPINRTILIFSACLLFIFISAGWYFFHAYNLFGSVHSGRLSDPPLTNSVYFFTQMKVIVKYFSLLLFPIHQNLDYDFPAVRSFFRLDVLLSFGLILFVFVSALVPARKKPIVSLGIFLFFAFLCIESGIVPIRDVIFEHRLYLPMAGFSLFLVSAIYSMFGEKRRAIFYSFLIAIIAFYSVLTIRRNTVWQNEITLWSDVAKKSPEKSRVHDVLGNAYFEQGQYDKALDEYLIAVEKNTKNFVALNNIGYVLFLQKKYPQSIEYYQKSNRLNPDMPEVYSNLASSYFMLGRYDRALEYFKEGAAREKKLLTKLLSASEELFREKNLEKAKEYYLAVTGLDAKNSDAYEKIGIIYLTNKQYDESVGYFNTSLSIDDTKSETYHQLALAEYLSGKTDRAFLHFRKSIELNPGNAETYLQYAMCLEKSGKHEEAQKMLDEGNRLLFKTRNR